MNRYLNWASSELNIPSVSWKNSSSILTILLSYGYITHKNYYQKAESFSNRFRIEHSNPLLPRFRPPLERYYGPLMRGVGVEKQSAPRRREIDGTIVRFPGHFQRAMEVISKSFDFSKTFKSYDRSLSIADDSMYTRREYIPSCHAGFPTPLKHILLDAISHFYPCPWAKRHNRDRMCCSVS